jgi:hypothetical protein
VKKAIPFLVVLVFILPAFYFSSQKKDDPNEYASVTALLILPFDTAKILEMMDITDSMNEVATYYNELDKSLYPRIDTLDLIWGGPITDCPDWRYADSTSENYSITKYFYIEPANDHVKLPDYVMRTRIQFIGREYGGISFPKGFKGYTSSPHAGRVFKYYAYKIYKPFSVYGPQVGPRDDDGYFATTQLIVK